jgi:uncharacterized protein DUF4256
MGCSRMGGFKVRCCVTSWQCRRAERPRSRDGRGQGRDKRERSRFSILEAQDSRVWGIQRLDQFDTTTSSWVQTPAKIRKLGGALFCDRRYDTVFVYHNGAESYYAARGFRCSLRV